LHLLTLSRLAALVVVFAAALHVALFGWIEAAARWLDERKMTADLLIYLFVAVMYTLAAVTALHGLTSWVNSPG
jgi:hypothetical protein